MCTIEHKPVRAAPLGGRGGGRGGFGGGRGGGGRGGRGGRGGGRGGNSSVPLLCSLICSALLFPCVVAGCVVAADWSTALPSCIVWCKAWFA